MALISGRAIRTHVNRSGFTVTNMKRSRNRRTLTFLVVNNLNYRPSDKGLIEGGIQEAATGERFGLSRLNIKIGPPRRSPEKFRPDRNIIRVSVTAPRGETVEL